MRPVRILTAAVAVAVALTIACHDSVAPVAGDLTLVLQTPNADDRSIVVRITGPNVTDVVATSAANAMHVRTSANDVRAAIFGALVNGPLLRFRVPDVSRAAEYRATVVEVGDASNGLRDVGSYHASITR